MKILIVDDNPSFLMLFKLYAENFSQFEFCYGDSGKEALNILENENNQDISLLVTDVRMPTLSGIDLSRMVKEIKPQIPIIFITGLELNYFSEEDLKFCTQLLSKDIGCEGILKEIKSIYNSRSQ